MVCIGYSSIMSGVVRIVQSYDVLEQYSKFIEILPLLGLVGIPLILVGAYIKSKDDSEKKKQIQIIFGMLLFIVVMLGIIVITVLSSK